MRLNGNPAHPWMSLILYVGAMLLLFEWITPLEIVSDTGYVHLFYLFVAYCFLLTAIHMPVWLRSPLKLVGLLFIIHYLFFDVTFLSREWIGHLISDLQVNIELFSGQNWMQLTPLFRTLLFLILLWMLSYLLYYWFVIVKRPLSFIVFTFIYITVLDTFTDYSAIWPIIRSFVIGVSILGVSHLFKMAENERIRIQSFRVLMKWLAPLLIVIVVGTSIGYAAPKFDPQWPDPVPFLQGAAEEGFSGSGFQNQVQRIGYGENDEQLGGGFLADDTTVFYASARTSQYWKVETKDFYTGKGWERTVEGEFIEGAPGEVLALQPYDIDVERIPTESTIQMVEPGNLTKLPYRYGTTSFTDFPVKYNPETGEVNNLSGSPSDGYHIEVMRPNFPLNTLREARNLDWHVSDAYLQLPDSIPDRIHHLTQEIIEGEENPYDQAKAIEQFFTRDGYEYETEDVPVPYEEADFVDQFLFETKRGYCDHYSTSMVVMLRSADIPARWVKGFTGGELANQANVFDTEGMNTYEIQNNHAHSWVEAYFPEVGWVPFEPTVGFSNQSDFVTGEDTEDLLDDREETEDYEQDIPEPELDEGPEQEETEEEDENETAGASDFSGYTFVKWLVVIGLSLFVLWLIFRNRYRFLSYWKKNQLKRNPDQKTFVNAYGFLLKLLSNEGYRMKSGQTLREFATHVDRQMGNSDMSSLTSYYERAVYREEDLSNENDQIDRLWNKIVRNLIA